MSADASPAVRFGGVYKAYGRQRALDGLSFSVPRGSICGLVGPNGAGKTTAFGIAGGFVCADAGEVDLLGEGPFDPWMHKGRVLVLPQDCELNPHTPVRALLRYFARLQGMSAAAADRSVDAILDEVELRDRSDALVRQLSHGMKRRVAVAQALLGAPALILLDEPTNGLDPELVVRMREVLRRRGGAATLIISSHVLSELEAICDHVVFMEAGRCIRQGSLTDVTDRQRRLRYVLGEPALDALRRPCASSQGAAATVGDALRAALPGLGLEASDHALLLVAPVGCDAVALNRVALPLVLAAGVPLVEIGAGDSLEVAWMSRNAGPT